MKLKYALVALGVMTIITIGYAAITAPIRDRGHATEPVPTVTTARTTETYNQAIDQARAATEPTVMIDRAGVAVKLAATPSERAEAHYWQGLGYHRNGRYDSAETSLRQSLRDQPSNSEAHYVLGVVLAVQARDDEAMAELTEAITLKSDNPHPYNTRAILYNRHNQRDRALADITTAIRLAPDYPPYAATKDAIVKGIAQ